MLAYLPVESVIRVRQTAYYQALAEVGQGWILGDIVMTEKRSNVIQMPIFTADAKKRWQQIPVAGQKELIDNVWCGQCRAVATIRIQDGEMCGNSLLLRGSCKKCGNAVARVIESDE